LRGRFAGRRPKGRGASFTAKQGAGLLGGLGGLPKSPRFSRLMEDRVTDLKRVLPFSVAFVVLDPIPNDLETPNE
jgi:hypothetical protein